MNRLLLVDGSNLLFQMFYGMPARILGQNGRPIQGTLGFVGALLRTIRMVEPSHVAVVFDGECHNPRSDIDPEYKADRPDWSAMEEEDTPFSQLPDICAALDLLGIRWRETEDCEADDWLAAYARQLPEDWELVIASQDSDLFQLITGRVTVLRYRGDRTVLCDPAWIRAKLDIAPEQYPCYKALVGDTSDHIRGIPGVGPKTAAALLKQFGSLQGLMEDLQRVERPAIRKALEENLPRLRTNDLLIRLSGLEELPFAPEILAWEDPGLRTAQVLQALGLR